MNEDAFEKVHGPEDKPPLKSQNACFTAAAGLGPSPPRGVEAKFFLVGDEVRWKGADKVIPLGTVGKVVRVYTDGDVEVRVQFGIQWCPLQNKRPK